MANEFGRGVQGFVPIFNELGLELYKSAGTPTASGPAKGALVVDITNAKLYQNTGTAASATWNSIGDVAASEITVSDGEFLVGNSSNVGASVAMSGDATLANTGAVTVASAAGTWTTGSTTTSSGAGAVAITGAIHEITTTGADALTLADGAEGQHLHIVMVADGGDGTLTPSNLAGATTITFNDVGDAVHLLFTAGSWHIMGSFGVATA